MTKVPTCVWRVSDDLVRTIDERLGDPLDTYVNGSQTWLLENGPRQATLEWRLHPVARYRRPAGLATEEVFTSVARAVVAGEEPVAPPAGLWCGLEAFPAYGDEVEPAPLRAAVVAALGLEPDGWGLVDHGALGDAWERSGGRIDLVDALLSGLQASV